MKSTLISKKIVILSLLIQLSFIPQVIARQAQASFAMAPSVFVFNSSRGSLNANMFLEHRGEAVPTPVEIKIYERKVDSEGVVVKSLHETRDFSVYPSRIVLMPSEKLAVQIQWVGSEIPGKEKQYAIEARQIPVEGEFISVAQNQPLGSVQILLKYSGIIVLTKEGLKSKVVSVEHNTEKIDDNILKIRIENQGSISQKLTHLRFKVTFGESNNSFVFKPEYMRDTIKKHSIFSGENRDLYVKVPEKIKGRNDYSIEPVFIQ